MANVNRKAIRSENLDCSISRTDEPPPRLRRNRGENEQQHGDDEEEIDRDKDPYTSDGCHAYESPDDPKHEDEL